MECQLPNNVRRVVGVDVVHHGVVRGLDVGLQGSTPGKQSQGDLGVSEKAFMV